MQLRNSKAVLGILFEEFQGGFRVIVYSDQESIAPLKVGKKVGKKVGEKVGERLTDNQSKIITAISINNKISIVELAKEVGMANKNIESNLNKLKKLKLLRRIGTSRGGHWEIVRD